MSTLTREIIFERTGLKVKFTSEEQLYALQALLKTYLPKRSKTVTAAAATATTATTEAAVPVESEVETTEVATKPKKVKKAKTVTATTAELLAPADAGVTGEGAPTLGATDEFRDNMYRLKTLDPALCCGRKIDAANPIIGTRPGDAGAKGKVFPEIQCSKKPVAGGRCGPARPSTRPCGRSPTTPSWP